jgi:hypothetical protein
MKIELLNGEKTQMPFSENPKGFLLKDLTPESKRDPDEHFRIIRRNLDIINNEEVMGNLSVEDQLHLREETESAGEIVGSYLKQHRQHFNYLWFLKQLYDGTVEDSTVYLILENPELEEICEEVRNHLPLHKILRRGVKKKTFLKYYEYYSQENPLDKEFVGKIIRYYSWVTKALMEDSKKKVMIRDLFRTYLYLKKDTVIPPALQKHYNEIIPFSLLSDFLEEMKVPLVFNAVGVRNIFLKLRTQPLEVLDAFYKVYIMRKEKKLRQYSKERNVKRGILSRQMSVLGIGDL